MKCLEPLASGSHYILLHNCAICHGYNSGFTDNKIYFWKSLAKFKSLIINKKIV